MKTKNLHEQFLRAILPTTAAESNTWAMTVNRKTNVVRFCPVLC